MNFLAHAMLAGPLADHRLGAILGDFVKGPLPAGLAPRFAAGVALHRRIDSFADSHPAFRASRARVSAPRRRYAGIMIDLFYDHFLALHWRDYHEQPLEEFAAEVYALWSARATRISPRLDELLPLMQSQDWLTSYRSLDAIATALDRMALRRLTLPNPLAGSGGELKADYPKFEQDFRVFFPAAQAYSADLRHRERRGALAA